MSYYQAVMFDLDGTLADTLQDIANAGNHALASLGHEPLRVERYRYLAGQGLRYLVTHALGPRHQDHVDEGIRLFREHYAVHKYDHTGPYAGIPRLLDALQARGPWTAVLSNKPHDATVEVVERLFGRWSFDAVRGHNGDAPLKPDPRAALEIADELDVEPERWIYIGDTKVDMRTGKNAGFCTIGVTWGFRDEDELRDNGADLIVHQPAEILTVLDGEQVCGPA